MNGALGLSERCSATAPGHSRSHAGGTRGLTAFWGARAAQWQRARRHALLVPRATMGVDAEAPQALEEEQEVSFLHRRTCSRTAALCGMCMMAIGWRKATATLSCCNYYL